jgi:hypothetical protein
MPGGNKEGGGLVTKRSALYQKSGGQAGEGSPIPQVLPFIKAIGSKIMQNKTKSTLTGFATHQAVTDDSDRPWYEKVVRAVDQWGPTLGVLSYIDDHAARHAGDKRTTPNPVTSPLPPGVGKNEDVKFDGHYDVKNKTNAQILNSDNLDYIKKHLKNK